MREGTNEQFDHFGEALYNILAAALSKHSQVQKARIMNAAVSSKIPPNASLAESLANSLAGAESRTV